MLCCYFEDPNGKAFQKWVLPQGGDMTGAVTMKGHRTVLHGAAAQYHAQGLQPALKPHGGAEKGLPTRN